MLFLSQGHLGVGCSGTGPRRLGALEGPGVSGEATQREGVSAARGQGPEELWGREGGETAGVVRRTPGDPEGPTPSQPFLGLVQPLAK